MTSSCWYIDLLLHVFELGRGQGWFQDFLRERGAIPWQGGAPPPPPSPPGKAAREAFANNK